MSALSSPHTHTLLCDGNNTAREMVEAAVALGMRSIGFSGHSPMDGNPDWCMTPAQLEQYIQQVNSLKGEFAGRIEILLGIELDALSHIDLSPFDYVIGSVHCLRDAQTGQTWDLDNTSAVLRDCRDILFGGDGMAMCRAYYSAVREMALRVRPDIIGHYDLITKCNDGVFDASSPEYRRAALAPLPEIVDAGGTFEVNSGAIYRGYTQTPYPADFLLTRLRELDAPVILSSDAHSTAALGFYWDESVTLLRSRGFSSMRLLGAGGFVQIPVG